MTRPRRTWQEELAIIDRTMKAISGVTDPEELVEVYWTNVGEMIEIGDYVAVSRRNVEPPYYIVTRSSRFAEYFNPWTQRDRLPRLTGGLLGEIAYANAPVLIDDLPARLRHDDPGHFYLEGFQSLVALPHYDYGESVNVTVLLLPHESSIEKSMIPMLHWQSGLFGRGTQNLVLRNQLADALAALDRELQVVGQIQRSLLPSKLPTIPGIDLAAHYVTSARAGGDYYDFFPLDGGAWGVFIADVSGHGTPAAVIMAITHALAHGRPGAHTPPGALLTYLNEQLARTYTRNGAFVTAFYAVLDPVAHTLAYATAGHNPPRLARAGRVLSLGEGAGLPLGLIADEAYVESKVSLESRDLLLLYTDGITEAMAPQTGTDTARELFGVERLDKLLLECEGRSAAESVECIRTAVAAFTVNGPPKDDQTLIAMRQA